MPVEGNSRLILAAKQSAKGVPNLTPTVVFPLSGDGALDPNREIIRLAETDGNSQQASSTVVGASPGGGWSGSLRMSQMKFLAEAVLGSISGAPTATAVPVKQLPYYTMFDVIPGKQCTRFDDVRIGTLGLSGESLQGVFYSAEAVALSAVLGAAEPAYTLPTDVQGSYPMVKVTVGGSWPGTHDAFALTIARNVTLLRGDMGLAAYDSWPGLFVVSGNFRRIYETDAQYRAVHGGSAAATTLTRTVFSESLSLLIEDTTTQSVEVISSGIEYDSITVPVNTDGTPVLQTLTFNTKRQATWQDNAKLVVKFP